MIKKRKMITLKYHPKLNRSEKIKKNALDQIKAEDDFYTTVRNWQKTYRAIYAGAHHEFQNLNDVTIEKDRK